MVSGRVIAFCEGRLDGGGDSGQINLLCRWSDDEGETWSPQSVIVTEQGMTCGNPCPVVDRASGHVILTFCKNIGSIDETAITAGRGPRTVWVTRSRDGGGSWSEPEEITAAAKNPAWTWYATGPCHGIQLESGRLVMPCDHMVGVYFDHRVDPYHSHVILSDDGGATWRIGGIVERGTNECAVAEIDDGCIYINCRNYRDWNARVASWSEDAGETFGLGKRQDTLLEPVCQASVIEVEGGLAFSNPASTSRERMTLRISRDGGSTWSRGYLLYEGPAAYSDLVMMGDKRVGCLYECGEERPYDRLRFEIRSVEEIERG